MNKQMLLLAMTGVALLGGNPAYTEEAAKLETGQEQIVTLPDGTPMAFVWIEPGTFQMGEQLPDVEWVKELESIALSDEGSLPVHEVEISTGFWLGKHEVTQGQWEAIMGTTPWRWPDNTDKELVQSNPAHPAVYISWHDTQALIQRLNDIAGTAVYRLPTEAEWEYACRSGTTTLWSFGNEAGTLFSPWSYDDSKNSFGRYAWYRANTVDRYEKYAHAVGQHRPNAWGLHDMHGNVWEWLQDWYDKDYYKHSSRVDPVGPAASPIVDGVRYGRVIRGGDFTVPVIYLRSASRMATDPEEADRSIGVRLVRTSIVHN